MNNIDMQLMLNICTLVTSGISLFTLFEMRKQRRTSQMPNILIPNKYLLELKANFNHKGEIHGCPYIWNQYNEIGEEKEDVVTPKYEIEIVNVGIGTATEICYDWEFNHEFFKHEINKRKKSNSFKLIYRDGCTFYSTSMCIINLRQDKNIISYIQSSQTLKIQLPLEYMIYLSLVIYLNVNKDEITHEVMEECEKNAGLGLTISYTDISGKKYKKKFFFQLKFMMLGRDKNIITLNISEK